MRAAAASVLDLLLPPVCAGCGRRGQACCAECLAAFGAPRAVRLGGAVAGVGVHALASYRGPARRLVLACKERGRRDLAAPLGAALARGCLGLPEGAALPARGCALVPVPSRRAASRARGGPHLLAIARACAAALGERGVAAHVTPALALARGAKDAVGLAAAQRAANLAGRVLVVEQALPAARTPVVLLDDVVTTGATAAACTAALAGAGVSVAAVLALTSPARHGR